MLARIMWQRLSLTAKLFVAIAAALLVVVLVIAAAFTVQMRAGFTTYLMNVELGRMNRLQDVLEAAVDADRGWPSLRDGKAWNELILSHTMPGPNPPFAPPPPPPNGGPERRHPRPPDPLRLDERLVLENLSGQIVAGLKKPAGDSIALELVGADGTALGRLRLYEPHDMGAPLDHFFGATQWRTFGLVLGLAVLLSAFVAWLLARQFSRPIRAIGESVSRLAAGDFEARLSVTRSDELGQLMRDHNALAASLERARQREREWITDASHELQTPLAILRAEIEALQDGIRQPTAETLSRLHASVMRLSSLVKDLNLSMSNAQASLDFVRVDVAALVGEAVHDSESRMRELGLEITTHASGPVPVSGDPGRLRQVVDNLLENACRYTHAPGRIRVTCETRHEIASIIMEDTPPSPAPDALPRLFDRFFRGESSRARTLGGSGLGLAICRAIVEMHHGRILAERSDMGGLKIRIELPMAAETPNG